jgi:hypothetical protein
MPHAYTRYLFRLLLLTLAEKIPDVSAEGDAIPVRIRTVCARAAEACGPDLAGGDLDDLVVAAFQMYEDHYIPFVIDGHVAELDELGDDWKHRLPEGR